MKISLFAAVLLGLLLVISKAGAQAANFVVAGSPAVAANPTCLAVADVNGDGKPDLICASGISFYANQGAITVLTNDGTGIFYSNATLAVSGAAPCVVVADVNGDGKPDLVCLVVNSGAIASLVLFTNNGGGIFHSNTAITAGQDFFTSAQCLAAADLKGDGKSDLLFAARGVGGDILSVYTNNGSGLFSIGFSFSIPNPQSVLVGDFNGDHVLDVISGGSNSGDPGAFAEFLNNGAGTLAFTTLLNTGENPTCLAQADVNGDGKPDLVCFDYQGHSLAVLTNFVNGRFVGSTGLVLSIVTNLSWIAAADLNQDKKVDLVTADPLANTLTVLTNNGSGVFGFDATLNVGRKPVFVVAADVNGDGKPDLITANQLDNTLTVLTNATIIPVPPLNIVAFRDRSVLFWPVTPQNYILQTTTNLASGNWATVSNGTQNVCITVSNSLPNAFYRLQPQ